MDDDHPALDTKLALPTDLEAPRDRRPAEPLRSYAHVDLVLEAEHIVELCFSVLAWVVAPPLEDAEFPTERRLRLLRPAERVREVDAPARVRVHPRHAKPFDVLYSHVRA